MLKYFSHIKYSYFYYSTWCYSLVVFDSFMKCAFFALSFIKTNPRRLFITRKKKMLLLKSID